MKRGLAWLTVATGLVLAVLPVAGHAASDFDPLRDADKVGYCFATYALLEEATLDLKPSEFRVYEDIALKGRKRIGGFVDASAHAVGQSRFYHRANQSMEPTATIVRSNAMLIDAVRDRTVRFLTAESKTCDELVAGWGPPPKAPE